MSDDREKELKEKQEKADATNSGRSGVGTRVRVGQTRGKASMVIDWEAFDTDKPETLPTSIAQFVEVTGVKENDKIVGFLIDGYNDYMYTQASDPIAEFVNPAWDDATKAQFRLVVRNYAKATGEPIDDVVAMMKPGIEKKYQASLVSA